MRSIQIMSVAAAVVLLAYVANGIAGSDLGAVAVLARIVVLAAAAAVAVVAYQVWSHANTPHTISAMIAGLLGGASLASTVTTATRDALYGSPAMALVGTAAVVAAATISHLGQTRTPKEDAR